MKTGKKMTAGMLSLILAGSMVIPVSAETLPSEKEEVIYVMTDSSGKVNDMEAVNIFSGGKITDYGDYSAVKMLNTTDKITQNGDEISFSSDADRVYYQGTMQNADLPWNISIRYFLDGKEYTAEDLAGQSGALEIKFRIEKNEKYNGDFYENYALQAAFSLDTDCCENIKADGATEANVGSKKQITYTILPGKGIETSIYADVTDFAMEAVTINGVRLNLNIDIDDAELADKVNEIVEAVNTVNSGASDIKDGTGKLADATETLNNKVGELDSGVGALAGGAGELSSGLSAITEKNDQLKSGAYTAYEGLCNAAASALNSQLCANSLETVTLTPSTYSKVLTGLLEQLNADKAFSSAAEQISTLKGQLDSYGTFYQGLLSYTKAVSNAASGADSLNLNINKLYKSTGVLKTSVGTLNDAVVKLYDGTKQLADGTNEFAEKTDGLDGQISDEIDSMVSSIAGNDETIHSFISDKNTNVTSVQFVMKTEAIEKPETMVEKETKVETHLSFWQKLLKLFGLYKNK